MSELDIEDKKNNEISSQSNSLSIYKPLGDYIFHKNSAKYHSEIKSLYSMYCNELLEIISLYRFQDEIDLFCRSESIDASAGGNKKGSLEDSAATEVQNLVKKVKHDFFFEFDERYKNDKCCTLKQDPRTKQIVRIDCETCLENKLAKAACAYTYSYQQSNRLPSKSNRRILSFPWLFSKYIIMLKKRQLPEDYVDQSYAIVGRACSTYLINFKPNFKGFLPKYVNDTPTVEFYYRKIEEKPKSLLPINKKSDEKICSVSLLHACFVEILNDWLTKQDIFSNQFNELDKKPRIPILIWHELLVNFLSGEYQQNVCLSLAPEASNIINDRYRDTIANYLSKWTNNEYERLYDMFGEIHSLTTQHAQRTQSTKWSYLDDYIILALQCIAIEKRLDTKWICSSSS